MTKQTAANNKLLKRAKSMFNAPMFREATRLVNTEGVAACVDFLSNYFRPGAVQAARRAEFAALAGIKAMTREEVEALLVALVARGAADSETIAEYVDGAADVGSFDADSDNAYYTPGQVMRDFASYVAAGVIGIGA